MELKSAEKGCTQKLYDRLFSFFNRDDGGTIIFGIDEKQNYKEVGVYDDRFFMYFEDWDLSRRMHQKYKTIYYPKVSVVHGYESGANKDKRLFKIFVKSAIYYFNKWGWFFDSERNKINKKTLQQF